MDTIPLYLKNTLRSLRIKYGYNQKEAAELLGISERTLGIWEKNSESISYNKIKKSKRCIVRRRTIFFLAVSPLLAKF